VYVRSVLQFSVVLVIGQVDAVDVKLFVLTETEQIDDVPEIGVRLRGERKALELMEE